MRNVIRIIIMNNDKETGVKNWVMKRERIINNNSKMKRT